MNKAGEIRKRFILEAYGIKQKKKEIFIKKLILFYFLSTTID
jgi:hypothetical protein